MKEQPVQQLEALQVNFQAPTCDNPPALQGGRTNKKNAG